MAYLNNFNILNIMNYYEHKYNDFMFLDVAPIDFSQLDYPRVNDINYSELMDFNINKICIIFNSDKHYKSGSRWISLYINLKKNEISYFDKYGKTLLIKSEIKKFLLKQNLLNKMIIKHNDYCDNENDNFYIVRHIRDMLKKDEI